MGKLELGTTIMSCLNSKLKCFTISSNRIMDKIVSMLTTVFEEESAVRSRINACGKDLTVVLSKYGDSYNDFAKSIEKLGTRINEKKEKMKAKFLQSGSQNYKEISDFLTKLQCDLENILTCLDDFKEDFKAITSQCDGNVEKSAAIKNKEFYGGIVLLMTFIVIIIKNLFDKDSKPSLEKIAKVCGVGITILLSIYGAFVYLHDKDLDSDSKKLEDEVSTIWYKIECAIGRFKNINLKMDNLQVLLATDSTSPYFADDNCSEFMISLNELDTAIQSAKAEFKFIK